MQIYRILVLQEKKRQNGLYKSGTKIVLISNVGTSQSAIDVSLHLEINNVWQTYLRQISGYPINRTICVLSL